MRFHDFQIVVGKEPENGGYYAHVPGLPGCTCTAGRTAEEARRNIREAILEYLAAHQESRAKPAPPHNSHHPGTVIPHAAHTPAA